MDKKSANGQQKHNEPWIAPGIEMDELDLEATEEEIKEKEYTDVTQLYVDRGQ